MNKQYKEVTKADLMPLEEYSKKRKAIRKEIVNYKKNRRVSVGPYANFYFESYKTILGKSSKTFGQVKEDRNYRYKKKK